MAGALRGLLHLVAAICLLPGVTVTPHLAGQSVDSASMGGGLQEPEAPEVMFELLWVGLELNVTGQLHILDEELASTRPGRRLQLLLQQLTPRDLEGAERRLQQLQALREGPPLSPWDFQQLLLTGLSCIYRLHAASEAEERVRWAHVFTLLTQEVLWDLCKDFCPQGQPPSLETWASIFDPVP
ncbi:PREDICTED: protein FAM180B [Chinchilla lanigera]|uniref:protein FAM180B n=1 Tax=Chinchilla lanigera TaxID=34839 RepID=UPI00038ED0DC|nr:PREDICTED: protein FAM180B [Chinchilla lanigera]